MNKGDQVPGNWLCQLKMSRQRVRGFTRRFGHNGIFGGYQVSQGYFRLFEFLPTNC